MTTICATLSEMAADSKCVDEDLHFTDLGKIRRIGATIVGVAGDADLCDAFFAWAADNKKPTEALRKKGAEWVALVLSPGGLFMFKGATLLPMKFERGWHAIGSGALGALVAMDLGKSPREAIEVTAKHENNTGVPVVVLKLKK